MDGEEFRRAFQRGRLLVLIVAVGTASIFFQDAARQLWAGGVHGVTSSQVVDWAFSLLICWWFFRGGSLSAGCLGTLYGICLLCFLAAVVYGLWNVFLPGEPLRGLHDRSDALKFFLMGAWAAFSFWVLLLSKDARVYREARRLAIRAQEADSFQWPPPGRHR